MKTVAIFTGARSEFGLLRPLITALQAEPGLRVKIIATGTHYAPSFGLTYREILASGLTIDEAVEIVLDSSTAQGVSTAMGLGLIRFGEVLARMRPDALVILGDRSEAVAAAAAAAVHGVPVMHLHGGEVTTGAIDDMFRHAITKLSQLHFTATEAYRQRVIQMGESPERVFNVGALGVENARSIDLLNRDAVAQRLGLTVEQDYLMITYHPVTATGQIDPEQALSALFEGLSGAGDLALVFTGANADKGGADINAAVQRFCAANPDKRRYFASLGLQGYLSAVKHARAVVGNSSSGLIEVPSFGVPSINIGHRQDGRLAADSARHCEDDAQAIRDALGWALSEQTRLDCARVRNPYEGRDTSMRIARAIRDFLARNATEPKRFHDLGQLGH